MDCTCLKKERVELHLHTNMSCMDATIDASDAILRAAEWGHGAVAITDHGCVYAFPQAARAAKKYGVKPIFGMEGYLRSEDPACPYHHVVLLACNRTGLKNLYKLVSLSHLYHFENVPLIPREEISAHREGLLIGSACEAGELFRAVECGKPWEELKRIASFYDYLEIQPLCNNAFLIRNGTAQSEDTLRDWNRAIVRLGEECGIPVCATGDVHFLDPEDELSRHVLLCARHCNDFDAPQPLYFRSTGEMLGEFAYLGADKAEEVVVTNTRAIADRVETFPLFPKDLHLPVIPGGEEALRQAIADRCRELYGETPKREVTERLQAELDVILSKGSAVVFEIARRLVRRSKEHGFFVGTRGAVASSLAAYFAGITGVNPLPPHYRCPRCKHTEFDGSGACGCGADLPDRVCPRCGMLMEKDGFDIPMETFFGLDGDLFPDIDLNFAGEYHALAHRHFAEMFGESHVFRAGTISTLSRKLAMAYVLYYMEETDHIFGPAEQERLAKCCDGVLRTTGQHPGGLVPIPNDLDVEDFTAVQYPANNIHSLYKTTHFEYYSMEESLLKVDMLGHNDPTILRMLEDLTGVNAQEIPLDDPDTLALFPARVPGVREFDSRWVGDMLTLTRPTCFADLVRVSGLSHSTGAWEENEEVMLKNGTASLRDVATSRDDIFLYLQRKGLSRRTAFEIMSTVRKGRAKRSKRWPVLAEEMRTHGVPEWYIDSLFKIVYLFPKAHAVSYVQMAFRIAWYKAHRASAFYAAYLTVYKDRLCSSRSRISDLLWMLKSEDELRAAIHDNEGRQGYFGDALISDEYGVLEYINAVCDAKRRGIRFLPPDPERSHPANFLPTEERILLPLSHNVP